MGAPAVLAVLGAPERVLAFSKKYGLEFSESLHTFSESLVHTNAGISEIVIPPDSDVIGKTPPELRMRNSYGLSILALHRGEKTFTEQVRDIPLQAGDTLVCHNTWAALARLAKDRNFVVVTTGYPHEELRPHKVKSALLSS